ncbi:ribbon-helix-helix protein, CopG family [Geoalkalibacter halelectricus]|uniref:DUF6290 family protein n=1 Tax=Geoalkalibacter halelectricus TaxID=2847045 RepID=A0ABY5ZIS3_9BACT|nr:ribbon-helix-helix protein, CopG family [Geoalkalibacter halelectricus]MDO3377947.1 DUF6290 family protein [Geoalkalibacter halelectricus]UWZ77872.1 DUF6290 family protein [Geoalkalibacter halelectricus]
MGKSVENPKRYIISCRISDQEMETLQEIAKAQGTSISTLLRRSLNLLEENHDRPQA